MPENKPTRRNKNLPVKTGDPLAEISKSILTKEEAEEWYLKAIAAEVSKPDFAIYCFDKALLFDQLHYQAEFRLAYLYHRVDKTLFIKHWTRAINKRFANDYYDDWDTFFKEDTLSIKELGEVLDYIELDTSAECNLVKGQIEFLLGKWGNDHFERLKKIICYDKEFLPNILSLYYPIPLKWLEIFKDKWNWEFLSSNSTLPWSEELIEEYKDKWNWHYLSINENLPWSEELIVRYRCKWDWEQLGINKSLSLSEELIKKCMDQITDRMISVLNFTLAGFGYINDGFFCVYSDKWYWSGLSGNEDLRWTEDLIEKYKNRWNWNELSSNKSLPWSKDLIEKYKNRWNWCNLFTNCSVLNKKILAKNVNNKYLYFFRSIIDSNTTNSLEEVLKINSEILKGRKTSGSILESFDEVFLESYSDKLDWKELSRSDLSWSAGALERYVDKWDWESLSRNKGFPWSIEFIGKYRGNWNWDILSSNSALSWSEELIEKYKDKWNWSDGYTSLSNNRALPWSVELIEKYEDKWNWETLSNNEFLPWSVELLDRFMDKWNWESNFGGISYNNGLTWSNELLEKYKDKLNWGLISLIGTIPWSEELIEKYKDKWKWECVSRRNGVYEKLFSSLVESQVEELMDYHINHFNNN